MLRERRFEAREDSARGAAALPGVAGEAPHSAGRRRRLPLPVPRAPRQLDSRAAPCRAPPPPAAGTVTRARAARPPRRGARRRRRRRARRRTTRRSPRPQPRAPASRAPRRATRSRRTRARTESRRRAATGAPERGVEVPCPCLADRTRQKHKNPPRPAMVSASCFVCGAPHTKENTFALSCCGARAHVDCLHTAVNFQALEACLFCHSTKALVPFTECARTVAATAAPWPCSACGGDTTRGAVVCEGRYCLDTSTDVSQGCQALDGDVDASSAALQTKTRPSCAIASSAGAVWMTASVEIALCHASDRADVASVRARASRDRCISIRQQPVRLCGAQLHRRLPLGRPFARCTQRKPRQQRR